MFPTWNQVQEDFDSNRNALTSEAVSKISNISATWCVIQTLFEGLQRPRSG